MRCMVKKRGSDGRIGTMERKNRMKKDIRRER